MSDDAIKKKLVGITSPPYFQQGSVPNPEDAVIMIKKRDYARNFYGNSVQQIGILGDNKKESTEKSDFDITQFHSCDDALVWHGCYDSDTYFKKYVTPESYAHPAKASFLLMDRIFKHLKHLGLLNKGDIVADFMAGSGRTNIMASLHGFDSVAIELEPHFIKMINNNKTLLERKIGRKVNWQIIQGDSRKLSEILEGINVGIISPPYSDQSHSTGWSEEYQKKFNEQAKNKWGNYRGGQLRYKQNYSSNAQNIGNLKNKPIIGIISPPYSGISETSQESSINEIQRRIKKGIKGAVIHEDGKAMTGSGKWLVKYSDSRENIANLPDKNLVGIISPPYENQIAMQDLNFIPYNTKTKKPRKKYATIGAKYSDINKENLGNQQGESYLQAMLQVYHEAAKVMSVLVTVTKNPTRNGKLRRLDLDTISLLEMAGYQIVDYHRAVLFEERKQATLRGGIKKQIDGRLSFFKRLSVQKGNLAANYEDVIIALRFRDSNKIKTI